MNSDLRNKFYCCQKINLLFLECIYRKDDMNAPKFIYGDEMSHKILKNILKSKQQI